MKYVDRPYDRRRLLGLLPLPRRWPSFNRTLQVPRCTKGAHPIQSYWQNQLEISFNLVFWTYQLAQGIKRYDHFRLANWHQSYIIDIIISQSAAAIVTHCQRTEASVSHLHQTLWGRNADSGNFYYTIFQDPGPIEKFYTWNCSQFHTDYEIIIRSDGHLLYTQEPAVPWKPLARPAHGQQKNRWSQKND